MLFECTKRKAHPFTTRVGLSCSLREPQGEPNESQDNKLLFCWGLNFFGSFGNVGSISVILNG